MSKEAQYEKEFLRQFHSLCGARNQHTVWNDFVELCANSLLNITGQDSGAVKRVCEIRDKYKKYEVKSMMKMLDLLGRVYETGPELDFLGNIMMQEGLSNTSAQQIFTPFQVAKTASQLTIDQAYIKDQIRQKGFISISDPSCGSGTMLIAAANTLEKAGVSFREKAWFVGQDIDYLAAMVCYIQLSLLGCPGFVVWGDTLSKPVTGSILNPDTNRSKVFFTLQACMPLWQARRIASI